MDYVTALLGFGIGFILILVLILVGCYVLFSISHMKALKALGYNNAWLAWIPYGVWFACADSVTQGEEKVKLFDSFELPAMVFKLWWIVPALLLFINIDSTVENVITVALNIVFLGCTYAKMYARLDAKAEKDEQVLGCISGFLPIIAVFKFLSIK